MLGALRALPIYAVDEHVGRVLGFYLDTWSWRVRYALLRLEVPSATERVLVPMFAFDAVNSQDTCLYLQLSTGQVVNTPAFDGEAFVSRDYEQALHRYHGWPRYWETLATNCRDIAGGGATGEAEAGAPVGHELLLSYPVQAGDGNHLGRVIDFVLAVRDWRIRALQIDVDPAGERPLLSCDRIGQVDHTGRRIVLDTDLAPSRIN